MQMSFTPEFARRLRCELGQNGDFWALVNTPLGERRMTSSEPEFFRPVN